MRTSIGIACAAILWLSTAAADAPPAATGKLEMPPEVTVHREIDRLVFADAKGMVLYTYDEDEDTPGTSSCTLERHCSRQWPPLLAPANAKPVGDWTVIRRQDGQPQWAHRGKPVYRYDDDLTPGVSSGDNARRLWHTLAIPLPAPKPPMPAGFNVAKTDAGWAFATHEGRTLYAPQKQTGCDTGCLARWESVPAPMLARPIGDWKPLRTADGTLQWSFRNQPLYVLKAGQAATTNEAAALQVVRIDASPPQ